MTLQAQSGCSDFGAKHIFGLLHVIGKRKNKNYQKPTKPYTWTAIPLRFIAAGEGHVSSRRSVYHEIEHRKEEDIHATTD